MLRPLRRAVCDGVLQKKGVSDSACSWCHSECCWDCVSLVLLFCLFCSIYKWCGRIGGTSQLPLVNEDYQTMTVVRLWSAAGPSQNHWSLWTNPGGTNLFRSALADLSWGFWSSQKMFGFSYTFWVLPSFFAWFLPNWNWWVGTPGYEEFLHLFGFRHPAGDVRGGCAGHYVVPAALENRERWPGSR